MKRKKNPIRALKTRAWRILAKYVRDRDPNCVTCGQPTAHCGHFIRNTERNQQLNGNALWWDLRNLGGQCVKCNNFGGGEQAKFAIYLEKKYGYGIVQELQKLRDTRKHWPKEEIEGVIQTVDNLTSQLDCMV